MRSATAGPGESSVRTSNRPPWLQDATTPGHHLPIRQPGVQQLRRPCRWGGGLCRAGRLRGLAGIHLEDPFLSVRRRGAQNPAVLGDVDASLLETLVETASTAGAPAALAQMTFAPERPDAAGLAALRGSHDVLAAVGHTNCDAETAWAALRAGLDAAPRF